MYVYRKYLCKFCNFKILASDKFSSFLQHVNIVLSEYFALSIKYPLLSLDLNEWIALECLLDKR